jgi:hypothetical protein
MKRRPTWTPMLLAALLASAPVSAGSRQVWVATSLSDPSPYVGQQIIYTFALYHAVPVAVGNFQPPDFSGFLARAYQARDTGRQTVDGREYGVTDIRYLLVPLAPGRQDIAPAALKVGIVRPDRQRRQVPFDGFFDAPFVSRDQVDHQIVQGPGVTVHARPLPPAPDPGAFSGLVGRFDMTASMEETQLTQGEATTLIITVQGEGNIMDARAPAVQLPDMLQSYADASEEEIALTPVGYSGKKVFRTILVPGQPGTVPLPPVRLTYFDVSRNAYRTLTAPLPALQVLASATVHPAPGLPVEVPDPGTRPPTESPDGAQPRQAMPWPIAVLGLFALAIACAALVLFKRPRRADRHPAAHMHALARRHLKAAQTAGDDRDALLTALYHALTAAVFCMAGRSGQALTWGETETLLKSTGRDALDARRAADLLAAIEWARYSGARVSADQGRELLARTRRMVDSLVS